MKLRVRLALAVIAALVPITAAFTILVTVLRGQMIADNLGHYARAIASSSREACEAAPERWGGVTDELLGAEFYAYDPDLRSLHPAAPVLDPRMIAGAQAGEEQVVRVAEKFMVLVQDRPAGPCAYILVQRPAQRPGMGPPGGAPWLLIPLLCMLLVLGVVLLLLGPVVRRIHRLRDEVRAAAAAEYRHTITCTGDDEIAELALAFSDSGRQIVGHLDAQERRERALREFLANTTHDVMVPLTVLQGHLAALEGQGGAGEGSLVRAAMQEADYIASLVHNLEVAARLDAGEPELARDPVELSSLIGRVMARHLPLARRRGVELVHAVPAEPLVVIGDLTLIERALSNLVQNAVLHNHAGGHVAVVLEEEQGHSFRVTIKDDGPGIAREELVRVLERGERGGAARTRHPHGKGLGLAIVRRVVATHAWQLEFRSGEAGGLEVEVLGRLAPSRAS